MQTQHARPPDDWLIPDWPAPAGVGAICSSRSGGRSEPPWDSLNLGDHVGDAPDAVARNRTQFAAHLLGQPRPVYLKQVHGDQVVVLGQQTPDGTVADGCVTREAKLACTIMVADCLPILLCSGDGSVVAAAHAGWRGLAGKAEGVGIVEQTFEQICHQILTGHRKLAIKTIASECLAWLGPCIGPQAFEVGAEVRQAFCQADADAAQHFVPVANADESQDLAVAPTSDTPASKSKTNNEKYFADLAALARQRLQRLGITQVYGNDSSPAWCTVSNPARYFSHRYGSSHGGASGRMAAAIWRN